MTGNNNVSASGEKCTRILMTTDTVGGVWRYSTDLIRSFQGRNIRVLLATMGPLPSEEQREQIRSLPGATLAESAFALEWMPDPWAEVEAAGQWLRELAVDFGADLIHLNGYAHGNLPWERPVISVAHSCVYSWWRSVHECPPTSEWSVYKSRVQQGLMSVDMVVAPSAYMARSITAEYSVPAAQVRVIHNFSRSAPCGGNIKEPFILSAGRIWDPAKNFALLDEIAPSLDWELRVTGSDKGPENSGAKVRSVRFLGMLPYQELLGQMQSASIFAHPAFYEPFGLSVLEAARAGCCLVLADIASLRELWNGAAIFVDPRDASAWIGALNSLIADAGQRRSLSRLAQSHALNYRAERAVADYLDVYEALRSSRAAQREGALA